MIRLFMGGKKTGCEVVSDPSGLYRVRWPDGKLSDIANLSRCCDAAREYAEKMTMLDRKMPVARRLKSLGNFWWSPSLVRQTRWEAA